jgi:5-hydroxyisourate hydrolase-like protein (transthyretin family)
MCFSVPRVSVLVSLVLVCIAANAQSPAPQIAGRVVRADNGLPIEGAAIELEPAGAAQGNGQLQTETTDSHGLFRFLQGVKDGTYIIKASAEGFVSQTYSRDGTLEGKFQPVNVSTRLREIDFRLKREAVIRGVVIDADGKPAGAEISVAAVRKKKLKNGSERLLPVTWTKTDASGRFVLMKLPSDTYFVCVNGPNGFNAFPDAAGWYRETWFGDVGSATGAIPVVLGEGEDRNDIRITAQREPRFRVIVWPYGPEDQPKPERYDVRIEGRSHSYEHQADGSYVLPGIPPGHYKLVSIAWAETQYLGEGDMRFEILDQDVTLHLRVGGLGEIQGVVKPDNAPSGVPAGVMIGIESQEGAAQGSDVDAVGRFTFGRVLPGGYEFTLLKNPAGIMLRSVRCGGVDVTPDSPLRVDDRQKVTNCEVSIGREAP